MKNLFLVTMIGLFSATTIYAQSDDTTTQFGVKGGVNLATITGDDVGDLDSRTSFNLGLFMEIPLSERFSFQPEVLYSSQGFSINDQADYKLDYVQVPLMAKVYIVKGLYAEAGPQFGFKAKEEVEYESDYAEGTIDFDPDDSVIKNFDTNLALGAGYKFDNGLSFSARYNLGLTSMIKDDAPIIAGKDVKNAVWQFGVGFSF